MLVVWFSWNHHHQSSHITLQTAYLHICIFSFTSNTGMNKDGRVSTQNLPDPILRQLSLTAVTHIWISFALLILTTLLFPASVMPVVYYRVFVYCCSSVCFHKQTGRMEGVLVTSYSGFWVHCVLFLSGLFPHSQCTGTRKKKKSLMYTNTFVCY